MTVVYAILIFGLIIFVHELGHFIAAKLSGITVYEFTIGFGPAVFKKKVGETVYAVRLLPVGGAVMMKDINEEPPEDVDPAEWSSKGSFQEAGWISRFAVTIAGSVMNFLCGVLIILIIYSSITHLPYATLAGFAEGFPLEGTLQVGDEIVKINDIHIFIYDDVTLGLQLGMGEPYDIVVRRNGEKVTLKNVPLEPKVYPGSENPRFGLDFTRQEASFGAKIKYSVNNAFSFFQSAFKSLSMLARGQAHASDLMGTVGIANEISQRAERSMADMWYFVAYIAVNLSFVNMLPIPGLDGGKAIMMVIELIRRKPIDPKWENYISYAGLALVMALFVFVTYNDIVRLIAG